MGAHDAIVVIGGGSSVKSMDVNEICKRGYSIGINGSNLSAPVDIGVSMDRRWAETYHNDIVGKPFWLRKTFHKWPELRSFSCDYESDVFSETDGKLNGRHSGYCGFNLAYQMKPKTIYLFGFDMGGNYWHTPYPWKGKEKDRLYKVWIAGFEVAKRICDEKGIKVYVVGDSKINCFPKISYKQFLQMEEVK